MYFSWATDLDPKGVNSQIKEAILSPGQGDDDSPATQSGTVERQIFEMFIFSNSIKVKQVFIWALIFDVTGIEILILC